MPNGVNQLDFMGRNILHEAFSERWVPNNWLFVYMIKILGLNCNHQDNYHGDTPIHVLCLCKEVDDDNISSCHKDAFKKLQKNGVNFNITNTDGWTPLHAACYGQNYNVVKLLLEINNICATYKTLKAGNTAFHYLFKISDLHLFYHSVKLIETVKDFLKNYPFAIFQKK